MSILDAVFEVIKEDILRESLIPQKIEWLKINAAIDIHNTLPGDHVMFHGEGGRDSEVSNAKKYLVAGEVYSVSAIDIQSWRTDIYLEGFDAKRFNSVLFSNVERKDGA